MKGFYVPELKCCKIYWVFKNFCDDLTRLRPNPDLQYVVVTTEAPFLGSWNFELGKFTFCWCRPTGKIKKKVEVTQSSIPWNILFVTSIFLVSADPPKGSCAYRENTTYNREKKQVTRGIFHSISHEKSVALVACIHSTINWGPDYSVPHMSRIECKYKKINSFVFPH